MTPLPSNSPATGASPIRGARLALGLLLAINLLNYIDRSVLYAVEGDIRKQFFGADTVHAREKTGLLATAFLVSYMLAAPLLGRLADRFSRWLLVGISVILWSLASGASGLAWGFGMLLITRMFVGIGEAGYGPAAPTIISDYYPPHRRGSVLAWFYLAIPVGSAIGYALGGFVSAHWNWRMAFYVVVPPGLLLGLWAMLRRDPPRGLSDAAESTRQAGVRDYLILLKTPSYVLDTAGMAAMTFAIGGISFWMPDYLVHRGAGTKEHVNIVFGIVTAISGIIATLLGGMAGDMVRKRYGGAYFLVSGIAICISCPLVLLMMWLPFPAAWVAIFLVVFFLFFNTGPSNAILANVTHPSMRATAFALNIFIIHALGDALSPPLLGRIIGRYSWAAAMLTVVAVMGAAGILWLFGARHLARDTELAPHRLADG